MSARMTVKARLAAESLCKTATATCQCGLEISNWFSQVTFCIDYQKKKKRDLKVFNVQKKLNKSTSRDPQMLPETEEIQYNYVTNLCMFCDVLQVRWQTFAFNLACGTGGQIAAY